MERGRERKRGVRVGVNSGNAESRHNNVSEGISEGQGYKRLDKGFTGFTKRICYKD